MMDAEKAPLVIIKGPAGTAKTFYSLAIGLHKILEPNSPPALCRISPNGKSMLPCEASFT